MQELFGESRTYFQVQFLTHYLTKYWARWRFSFARSSHRRCSVKKGVLRNFAKFTEKPVRDGWKIQRRIDIISHDFQLTNVKKFGDVSTPYIWAANVMKALHCFDVESTWHAKEGGKGVEVFKVLEKKNNKGEEGLILLGRWKFVMKNLENFHYYSINQFLLLLKKFGERKGEAWLNSTCLTLSRIEKNEKDVLYCKKTNTNYVWKKNYDRLSV